MKAYCTRPTCQNPINFFNSLSWADLQPDRQRFCSTCAMPLMLGGQYLPVEQLGAGANRATFLAVDLYTKNRRQCVIKQFSADPEFSSSQISEIKDHFSREAQALESLCGHSRIPSLCCYLDLSVPSSFASQPSQPEPPTPLEPPTHLFYLVWEYIEGQDLAQELSKSDRFSEAEVLTVLHELLPLLRFIHEHHVIHQAIDLSHIIRDPKGQLCLVNFGGIKQAIAKLPLSSKKPDAFSFVAPEQRTQTLVCPASDLYSLAVAALCLLGGYKSLQEMYDPDTERWNWHSQIQVSDRLGSVLNKLLEPNLERRFQSAAEALAALPQAVFSAQSVESRPDAARVEVLDGSEGRVSAGEAQTDFKVENREIRSVEDLNTANPFDSISNLILEDFQFDSDLESQAKSQAKSKPGFESGSQSDSRAGARSSSKHTVQFDYQAEPAEREDLPLVISVCQAAILGSGGWILAIALVSFLGTMLASGFWVLILGGLIFSVLARTQTPFEKTRFLMIALVAVGAVFFLFPQFLSAGTLFRSIPLALLLAVIAGLIAFVLVVSFQFLEKLINGID